MYAVQSEGCAPIVKAFNDGAIHAEPWGSAETFAAGIRVPSAIGDYLILQALRDSNGGAVSVADEEIMLMVKTIFSTEGIFVCPEGAATACALSRLIQDGSVSSNESVLLLNTGSGLKYLDVMRGFSE
tara:strand:- start:119 stop:502 length:384 start_codon:yes stop_codon:yes gene_type:complete